MFDVPSGLLRMMDRDLKAAGIPKVDADGMVVHIHALRHSFGTHLSKAGVAPRVAQAAMRHSNISLTMGTYTDARLLDTAEAVESLPMFKNNDAASLGAARTLAPTLGRKGKSESRSDHLVADDTDGAGTKKPRQTLGLTGFSAVGDIEFESTTSTMSTWRSNQLS